MSFDEKLVEALKEKLGRRAHHEDGPVLLEFARIMAYEGVQVFRKEQEYQVNLLRNLLREWAGMRTKKANLRARTMNAIEETKLL